MKAFDRVLAMFGILLLVCFRADAHDPSMQHHEWFNAQEMNPAARQRLGVPWKSCCDNGDGVGVSRPAQHDTALDAFEFISSATIRP